MRQIVLDTETTGLEPQQGHKIIEIGCVEVIDRKLTGRHYHQYINPERLVDEGAMEVHGITDEFLKDKPVFAQIADEFWQFIKGSQLVIHNAPFDVGFINHEFSALGRPPLERECTVLDTLLLARQKHPGQKNNLDALCKRYAVDNSQRELHGALLDAEILADVYLLMTGGQTTLELASDNHPSGQDSQDSGHVIKRLSRRVVLPVLRASDSELAAHLAKLEVVNAASGGKCIWQQSDKTH